LLEKKGLIPMKSSTWFRALGARTPLGGRSIRVGGLGLEQT
jgi:hypothetical protein